MKARAPRPTGRLQSALAIAAAMALAQAAMTTPVAARPADPNAPASTDPNAGRPKTTSKPEAPAKVFTNKDLSRYRSAGSQGTVVVDMNAVQQAKDDEAAAAAAAASEPVLYPDEKARRMAELQDAIKDAESRIAAIDERVNFLANGFLPPPQLTPEQIKAVKGMSSKEAYLALQAEKGSLTEKLVGLRDELAKVISTPTKARSTPAVTNPAASQPASPN